MNFVIDRNIRGAESTFARHGEVRYLDGRKIRKPDLAGADALIVRTTTRIDEALLGGTDIRFVGTTSIGTDHLDIDWLASAGIPWANAPGCNADSAAQYTLAMAWLACERLGRPLDGQRVGIIGRGNVGSRVQHLMRALGLETAANDPPLADRGEPGLTDLADVLDSDIVCLHVPLTDDGPYPTLRMIGTEQLAHMRRGALLINSARGNVIDGPALLGAIGRGMVNAALDVWPGEPNLDPELLERATVATPHVAGYSDDGKRNGTRMVYDVWCRWAGVAPVETADEGMERQVLELGHGEDSLARALEATCFVRRHDQALRECGRKSRDEIAPCFDQLRRNYPYRRDFRGWTIRCADSQSAGMLKSLGFRIE